MYSDTHVRAASGKGVTHVYGAQKCYNTSKNFSTANVIT
jgi:hypothetical protein